MHQTYYREFNSMKNGVERYLNSSRYLRIIRSESDSKNNKVVYKLGLHLSLFTMLSLLRVFKLTIEKVDEKVTRMEFHKQKKLPNKFFFFVNPLNAWLDNFVCKF